jgi:hypothetical protein
MPRRPGARDVPPVRRVERHDVWRQPGRRPTRSARPAPRRRSRCTPRAPAELLRRCAGQRHHDGSESRRRSWLKSVARRRSPWSPAPWRARERRSRARPQAEHGRHVASASAATPAGPVVRGGRPSAPELDRERDRARPVNWRRQPGDEAVTHRRPQALSACSAGSAALREDVGVLGAAGAPAPGERVVQVLVGRAELATEWAPSRSARSRSGAGPPPREAASSSRDPGRIPTPFSVAVVPPAAIQPRVRPRRPPGRRLRGRVASTVERCRRPPRGAP